MLKWARGREGKERNTTAFECRGWSNVLDKISDSLIIAVRQRLWSISAVAVSCFLVWSLIFFLFVLSLASYVCSCMSYGNKRKKKRKRLDSAEYECSRGCRSIMRDAISPVPSYHVSCSVRHNSHLIICMRCHQLCKSYLLSTYSGRHTREIDIR